MDVYPPFGGIELLKKMSIVVIEKLKSIMLTYFKKTTVMI